jgi:glycosyltransferase involved in cell wall biosynthesis
MRMAESRLRLVFITCTLDIGGAERQVVETVRRLDRERFDVRVCTLADGEEAAAELRAAGIEVRSFGYRGLWMGGKLPAPWRGVAVTAALVKYLKAVKPHILHGYLYAAYVYGGLAARLSGVPLVIASRRVLGLFKERYFFYQPLENLVNRFTDLVIVNSEAVRRDILHRERLDPRKIRLIYNGVDLDRYVTPSETGLRVRAELGVLAAAPLVGIIANLIPYKGHRDFLQSAAIVAAEFPQAHFLVVGRDDGIGAELRRLAGELGLFGRVLFTGPRRDIPQILSALDVQVLASHQEAFSNAILEGMAAGKPLVVTDVGGNPEAVLDGETGFVVPPHDPQALADAVLRLLRDEKVRLRLGEAGQRRVREFFSVESMVQKTERIYQEAMANRGYCIERESA